jgi:C-terminal processing protease CtpA/Prc
MRDLRSQGCDRLIIDLRGNIGGSLGFARLASYLCAGRIPIGHSLTPTRLRNGYTRDALPRVPMPRTTPQFMLALARFALRDKSVMLLTQGLGPQPFHGRVAILVNEWTNSAAEMLASFASENRLATIIGTKTAGNVLGAVNQRVGAGYWLRVPVFGWCTPNGKCLEGQGVLPDLEVDVDPLSLDPAIDQLARRAAEVLDAA